MPTSKVIDRAKRDLVNEVIEAAMHIIHESYLPETNIWPKKGFVAGWGKFDSTDMISIGVSIHGDEQVTLFNVTGKNYKRIKSQLESVELIMSDAVYNNIIFTSIKKPSIARMGLVSNFGQVKFNFIKF